MKFIKMVLRQLPFFEYLQDNDTSLYDIIYKMRTITVPMGPYKEIGDNIDEICIIEHGIAEVYLTVNGRDMLFERLFRGSVINYKSIFQQGSQMQVNIRFANEAVIKVLSRKNLQNLTKKHKAMEKNVRKFTFKMNRINQSPLDYIISLPKPIYRELIKRTRQKILFSKQEKLMKQL